MKLSVIIVYACCMGLSACVKNTLNSFVDILTKFARLLDGEVGVRCDTNCSTTNKASRCVSA